LATLAHLSLAASAWIVYNQWLWLSLAEKNPTNTASGKVMASAEVEPYTDEDTARYHNDRTTGNNFHRRAKSESKTTTLRVLDAATSAQYSTISLLHFWLFKDLKIAYILAIIAW
jgi:hypothetical protein